MRDRVGSIFASSPDSVMPAHFDIEHSLLMPASGATTIGFGPRESELPRRHEVQRYWGASHRWIESLPPKLAPYEVTPGRGVCKPPVEPHWVHNRPAISLSVTLCFAAITERENAIETFNGSSGRFTYAASGPVSRLRRRGQSVCHAILGARQAYASGIGARMAGPERAACGLRARGAEGRVSRP